MPTAEELGVLGLSLRIALTVLLLSLPPGILLGTWLARSRSKAVPLVQGLVMLPMVLPPIVTGYGLLLLFGRTAPLGRALHALTGGHLAYTTGACVLAAAVVGFPLLVESVRLAVLGIDPRLEQVSRSLGRGRAWTFGRVTLPLALPGILAGSVLAFARALGEFGATIVLAGNIEGETRQIPLAVYTLLNTPGREGSVLRLCLMSATVSIAAILFAAHLQRRRRSVLEGA